MVYLVEKYGKTASLYPADPKARALVNQRLYFDLGTLYQRFADYYYPQIFAKAPANPDNFKKLEDAVAFLNTFLEGQTYAVSSIDDWLSHARVYPVFLCCFCLFCFILMDFDSFLLNFTEFLLNCCNFLAFTGRWQLDCCWHFIGSHRIIFGYRQFRFVEIPQRCCMVWKMQSHHTRLWH